MLIREIEEKDNKKIESLIRTCLIEFGANKEGCAWSDPNLDKFYQIYKETGSKYWVVEKDEEIVAGCGIGKLEGTDNICELQKMYCAKEYRGHGFAKQLFDLAIEFAKKHYKKCYLETFENMVGANKFYIKNGFQKLENPIIETEHFACDCWYIKKI